MGSNKAAYELIRTEVHGKSRECPQQKDRMASHAAQLSVDLCPLPGLPSQSIPAALQATDHQASS